VGEYSTRQLHWLFLLSCSGWRGMALSTMTGYVGVIIVHAIVVTLSLFRAAQTYSEAVAIEPNKNGKQQDTG